MSKFKDTTSGMMLALFVFMTRTAHRAHEIVGLKWSSLICTPEGEEVFRYRKKGGKESFTAPGKKAIDAVREYHRASGIESDFLFVSLPARNGRRRNGISTRSLQRIINAWDVKTSSGRLVHPHAIRHTAAQRAFDKAGSLAAQKLCGHSTPVITSKFYTRPYLSNVEELLDW